MTNRSQEQRYREAQHVIHSLEDLRQHMRPPQPEGEECDFSFVFAPPNRTPLTD
jgi:hypothetical protein